MKQYVTVRVPVDAETGEQYLQQAEAVARIVHATLPAVVTGGRKAVVYHHDVIGNLEDLARMLKDGETDSEGYEFVMENDDAWETLHGEIEYARAVTGIEPTT